jgi:hypothetical protein
MQSSLPTGPADQNIKAVDPAEFAEIEKIVGADPRAATADYPRVGELKGPLVVLRAFRSDSALSAM